MEVLRWRLGMDSAGGCPVKRRVARVVLPRLGRLVIGPAPRRGRSSVGRAPEWHSGGQGFDSPRLHQRGSMGLAITLRLLAASEQNTDPSEPVWVARFRRRSECDDGRRAAITIATMPPKRTVRRRFCCSMALSRSWRAWSSRPAARISICWCVGAIGSLRGGTDDRFSLVLGQHPPLDERGNHEPALFWCMGAALAASIIVPA
jgi:hypothetical protein